jgi:hypothetical protein
MTHFNSHLTMTTNYNHLTDDGNEQLLDDQAIAETDFFTQFMATVRDSDRQRIVVAFPGHGGGAAYRAIQDIGVHSVGQLFDDEIDQPSVLADDEVGQSLVLQDDDEVIYYLSDD